jgi:AraC family transcriptional regulator
MRELLEPPIDSRSGAIDGIAIDWLFVSPSFGMTLWNCHAGRRGLSDERIQRWHVISFVHESAFVLHAEGRSDLVDSTAAILYNPCSPYRSTHPFGCSDHGSAVVVHRRTLLRVMARYNPAVQERPDALFPVLLGRGLSRAYLLQRTLVRGLRQGASYDPLELESALLSIVGAVAKSACQLAGQGRKIVDSSRARRSYVLDAQVMLKERFREPLRIEDVAEALHVSPYHLCRLFKKETGIPIHRYLNRLRLREALEPIADGVNLGELALSLGFVSHSHFTTAFRKEFGVPPSQARPLAGLFAFRARLKDPPIPT